MPLRINCRAVLCDMDGTLVDSTASVEAVWGSWAARHGVDVNLILAVSHGRRTLDTLREIAPPHLDIYAEARLLEDQEVHSRDGIRQVPGAANLIAGLPLGSWSVVTSASRSLAAARLQMAGLPVPEVLISADDVAEGKPHPEGYLKAAAALGVAPSDCLVLEDTPAGIEAGRAAGTQVLALTTTYSRDRLLGADCIPNFLSLTISLQDGCILLHA